MNNLHKLHHFPMSINEESIKPSLLNLQMNKYQLLTSLMQRNIHNPEILDKLISSIDFTDKKYIIADMKKYINVYNTKNEKIHIVRYSKNLAKWYNNTYNRDIQKDFSELIKDNKACSSFSYDAELNDDFYLIFDITAGILGYFIFYEKDNLSNGSIEALFITLELVCSFRTSNQPCLTKPYMPIKEYTKSRKFLQKMRNSNFKTIPQFIIDYIGNDLYKDRNVIVYLYPLGGSLERYLQVENLKMCGFFLDKLKKIVSGKITNSIIINYLYQELSGIYFSTTDTSINSKLSLAKCHNNMSKSCMNDMFNFFLKNTDNSVLDYNFLERFEDDGHNICFWKSFIKIPFDDIVLDKIPFFKDVDYSKLF